MHLWAEWTCSEISERRSGYGVKLQPQCITGNICLQRDPSFPYTLSYAFYSPPVTQCLGLFLDYQDLPHVATKCMACPQWTRSRTFHPTLTSSRPICSLFPSLTAQLSCRWQLVNPIKDVNLLPQPYREGLSAEDFWDWYLGLKQWFYCWGSV